MSNLTKKEIEEYLCKVYFIDISNPIKASIKRAYLDFCRTLHGLREYEGLRDNAEKVLERQINELFKLEIDSQESFDQWHKSCCDKLIQCFEVYGNFHYGQAQKWINMSLKYIFVFDQQLTDNIYQYFHIPIDNVVLEGLKGMKRIYSFTFCCPWSKIDSYEEYLKFQIWFRNTFYGIPMDNEFRLWMGKDLLVKDERASIPELQERETAKAAEQLPETSSEPGFSSAVRSPKKGRKEGIYFMTIDQVIVEYANEVVKKFGSGTVKERKEIIQEVHSKYGKENEGIIPSDYCYNRVNNGIKANKPTLFIYIDKDQYECVGLNYPYNGVIWHRPKGEKVDIPVGKCVNGKRVIAPDSNFHFKS